MKRLSSLLLAVALVLAAFAAMPEETQAAEKEVAVYVVSEMISILPDNSTSTPIVYTYTEKGLIKNKGEKDSYWKDKYTYNSDNRMKTFKEKSSTTPYKYYYKNGKLSKCKIYNWTTKYSYNKAGLLNEEKMYLNTDGKVYGSASYKYDSNGCVTSVESFQNGMNAKYTFKYDDFGNIKNSVIKSDTGESGYRFNNTYSNGRLTKRTVKTLSIGSAKWKKGWTEKFKYKKIMVPKSLVKRVKKQQEVLLLEITMDNRTLLAAA